MPRKTLEQYQKVEQYLIHNFVLRNLLMDWICTLGILLQRNKLGSINFGCNQWSSLTTRMPKQRKATLLRCRTLLRKMLKYHQKKNRRMRREHRAIPESSLSRTKVALYWNHSLRIEIFGSQYNIEHILDQEILNRRSSEWIRSSMKSWQSLQERMK